MKEDKKNFINICETEIPGTNTKDKKVSFFTSSVL